MSIEHKHAVNEQTALVITVGLSDSENNTITIVKIVVFTIVNTITIVGYQFFNTMIINKEA